MDLPITHVHATHLLAAGTRRIRTAAAAPAPWSRWRSARHAGRDGTHPGVAELLGTGETAPVRAVLAPAVTFHSPVARYEGRDTVARLLTAIGRCVDRVESRVEYAAGARFASEFTAEVGGRPADGVLVRQVDPDGLVDEVTLLLRPLAALLDAVDLLREALTAPPRAPTEDAAARHRAV